MDFDKLFAFWPILPFGSEDQDPPKDGPKDEGGQQNPPGKTDEEKPPESKDGGKKQNSDDDDDNPYKGLTTKELARMLADSEKGKKDVETERDSYKTKVDEAERATRTKEENLENDVKARDATITTLRATNARLAIINAILAERKYSWHNPEIVAQQLDPKVVKVSDDGKVEGLTKELARVAKDHDYLLAKNGSGQQGPTGIQPGQGGSNQGKSAKDLAKDYPALLGRV